MLSQKEKDQMNLLERTALNAKQETNEWKIKADERAELFEKLSDRCKFLEGILGHMLSKPISTKNQDGLIETNWRDAKIDPFVRRI